MKNTRYYLYVCTGEQCDDKPLIFDDLYGLLDFIHGLFRFNKKVDKIIVKKVKK